MLIKLYDKNPDPLLIEQVVDVLEKGGVIIYPTDTVYGIGCDITKARAIERVARIKGLKPEKANLLYEYFITRATESGVPTQSGIFQAMMDVGLINQGPVTILIDTKNK